MRGSRSSAELWPRPTRSRPRCASLERGGGRGDPRRDRRRRAAAHHRRPAAVHRDGRALLRKARSRDRRARRHHGKPARHRRSTLGAFSDLIARADLIVLLGKALDFTLRFGDAPFVDPACA